MKIRMLSLAAALVAAGSASASTVRMDISGSITPAPCTVSLSNGGSVSFGDLRAESLKADAATALDAKTVTVSVACNAATAYGLQISDDRASSVATGVAATAKAGASDAQAFGLGMSGAQAIGAYVVSLSDGVADGTPTTFIGSADNGATWNAASVLAPNGDTVAWRSAAGATPVQAASSSALLTINAAVVGTDRLDLSEAVDLDGSAVIELLYL